MTEVLELLRDDVLDGRVIVLAGPRAAAMAGRLSVLGARTRRLEADLGDEAVADAAVAALGPVDALVVGAGAPDGTPLHAGADAAWVTARAVANGAWIGPAAPGGKIVFLAPPPASADAQALRAAFENLARALSIEWARFGIRITTITPGAATTDDEVTAVAAYLLSAAGEYFSGARLDLGAA